MRTYNEETRTPTIATIDTSKCTKLNVRATPDLNAKILKILGPGDEVTVDPGFKNTTFYKITSGNVVGYVVKLYLKLKK